MSSLFNRLIFGFLLTLLIVALVASQETTPADKAALPGENAQARNRIASIEHLLPPAVSPSAAAGCVGLLGGAATAHALPLELIACFAEQPPARWEQIDHAYYDLLNDLGSALVALPASPGDLGTAQTILQVRRRCYLRLAGLPAAARASFRQRGATEAERLLALGRAERDPAPLRQLVDEQFCSSCTDAALDLLGDLAFERGEFVEAAHWWRQLAPLEPRDGTVDTLRFPEPQVDRARVQAKQILALAFAGRFADAQDELNHFRRHFPNARGPLAGADGPYGEAVQKALDGAIKAGITNNTDPWTTFAGANTRNRVLTVCPSARLWEDDPTWQVPLPQIDAPRIRNAPPGRRSPTWRAAFHPVIVGNQVLLADAHAVTSYDRNTGKRLFRHGLNGADPGAGAEDPNGPGPRFTVSADAGRAYARLGRQTLAPMGDHDPDASSFLVCLDLAGAGDVNRTRELWRVKADGADGGVAVFESAPLVRANRAYVALSRLADRRITTAIQCYDSFGRLRWSRDVCTVPDFEESAAPRLRHHLLTWAGGALVYGADTGVVVAVDPWTGQTLWAVRYPRRGSLAADGKRSPRDLAPCVYADGRLFVNPRDSDRLYCLESCTGQVIWEREQVESVHLLGVARGRLYYTTWSGLNALSVADGNLEWQEPSDGKLAGLGRGLLAGGWLFWPTQDLKLPLRAVGLAEGSQQRSDEPFPFAEPSFFDPTQLRAVPPGNFAFGEGCLVVAGTHTLTAFVPTPPAPPPAVPGHLPHVNGPPAVPPLLPTCTSIRRSLWGG